MNAGIALHVQSLLTVSHLLLVWFKFLLSLNNYSLFCSFTESRIKFWIVKLREDTPQEDVFKHLKSEWVL